MFKKFFFALIACAMSVVVAHGANNRFTLVVDAGHGGRDHGAPGTFSKEKDLTLKYALSLGRMIERNCPDVQVIYTRKTDVFVPLIKRAEMANQKKADLFISIHINALERNRTARGFQSYTLGRSQSSGDKGLRENLEVAKRENSVIYLEKDYQTVYKGFEPGSAESDIMFEFVADKNRERSVELSLLMQKEVCRATGRPDKGAHQNNLAVLRLTSMPAVLLELGFISTPEEEQFLNSPAALDLYTKGMYNAFILYKNKYDDKISVPYRTNGSGRSGKVVPVEPPVQSLPVAQPMQNEPPVPVKGTEPPGANASARMDVDNTTPVAQGRIDLSKPVFKVQILAVSSKLKERDHRLKGLKNCEYYVEGGLWKYTFGASNNYNEIYRLRKEILEMFPQSFIIAFKNGRKMDVNEGIREFKANR